MAKKKNPRFGGKRDLKDTSGDGKITFADTYLGDLLGFDGTAGTKGKPGLLKSLGGARRMKDGVTTSKRPKARPASVTTAAKTEAAAETARKNKATLASETRRQQSQVKTREGTENPTGPSADSRKNAAEEARKRAAAKKGKVSGPSAGSRKRAGEEARKRQAAKKGKVSGPAAGSRKRAGEAARKRAEKVKTPAQILAKQKKMMKLFTHDEFKDLSPAARESIGLPRTNNAALIISGALFQGGSDFKDMWKQ